MYMGILCDLKFMVVIHDTYTTISPKHTQVQCIGNAKTSLIVPPYMLRKFATSMLNSPLRHVRLFVYKYCIT